MFGRESLAPAALAFAISTLSTTATGADMSSTAIKQGYLKHAALSQYHRWYQVYERPDGGISNALDILADNIIVKSGLGEARGHDQYAERVAQLPSSWKNAHHVKSTKLTVGDDDSIDLVAEITYLNQGIKEDGAVRKADLTYTMALEPGDTVLPKFTNISIVQNSDGDAEQFDDAYAKNRSLSLVHYWLALIEDPSRDPEPVQEILAEEFSLNFSSGAITDFEGFKAWLAGPGSAVTASTHEISNFEYNVLSDDQYSLVMDFDWTGIIPGGAEMIAKTRHSWVVNNKITERFARIKSVDVEVLEKFRPKTK